MNNQLPDLQNIQFYHKGILFYGGSQQMYSSFLKRLSGCGPTTASNLFIYLSQAHPQLGGLTPQGAPGYDRVLGVMNTLWKYITPGLAGVDSTEAFVVGATNYLAQYSAPLSPLKLDIPNDPNHRPSMDAVYNFLSQQLWQNSPVAFLNLHGGELANLPSWHWVLLVGVKKEGETLWATIYDEGREKVINLSLWLTTTRSGGGFVSFEKMNPLL